MKDHARPHHSMCTQLPALPNFGSGQAPCESCNGVCHQQAGFSVGWFGAGGHTSAVALLGGLRVRATWRRRSAHGRPGVAAAAGVRRVRPRPAAGGRCAAAPGRPPADAGGSLVRPTGARPQRGAVRAPQRGAPVRAPRRGRRRRRGRRKAAKVGRLHSKLVISTLSIPVTCWNAWQMRSAAVKTLCRQLR